MSYLPKNEMKAARMITIIGLGSLLSEESARKTCPSLQNFRLATVNGYKRVFNKTDSDLARTGNLPSATKAYACLSAIPDAAINNMRVSVFHIPEDEWLPFVRREFEYKLLPVPFQEMNGNHGVGIMCVGNYVNDEECRLACQADPLRHQLWLEFTAKCTEPMWRDDLLPEPQYLKKCLTICQSLGDDVFENFIRTTFIGNGHQTIASYLNLSQ